MARNWLGDGKGQPEVETPSIRPRIGLLLFLFPLFFLFIAGCSIIRGDGDEPATVAPPTQVALNNPAEATPEPPPVANDPPAPMAPPPVVQPGPTTVPTTRDDQSEAETNMVYEVQLGDTLWGIAMLHDVSLDALLAANNIDDPNTIWVGQELVIPNASQGVAQAPPAQPTSTPAPSTEDTPSPLRTDEEPVPAANLESLPDQVLMEPMLHDWQKMNNCGPTTMAMALSYYDLLLTQFDTAPVLKGGPNDKNVSPPEMAAYARSQGFSARVRVNGDLDILRQLAGNGIPVIVEQWLDRPDEELTGHYRVVRGYDEAPREFIVNDSFSGPKLRFSYEEFDRLWRPFNRAYIPIYELEREPLVKAILGDDWDDARMYERAAEQARTEIEARGDAYAWFNLGSSLVGLGDYAEAADAFDRAIEIGLPAYMFWYQFGPFEAYNQTRQFQRVIDLSAPLAGIALEELHYHRGVAFEGLEQFEAALAEYQRAVELNPRLMIEAAEAVARLEENSSG